MRRGGSEHDIKISDLLKKQLNKKKISAIMSGFLIAQLLCLMALTLLWLNIVSHKGVLFEPG